MRKNIFSNLVTAFAAVTLFSLPLHAASARRMTFDLGLSSGTETTLKDADKTVSYTEIGLGLNYYFVDYLAWRNAIFTRFATAEDTLYGLDTSLRLIGNVGDRAAGLTAFVAPGFRFQSARTSAPFGEAGLVFHIDGVSVGGGVKSIFNSWVKTNQPNDTQVFLILAGGGSL